LPRTVCANFLVTIQLQWDADEGKE